jgi:hypothetical protein
LLFASIKKTPPDFAGKKAEEENKTGHVFPVFA